MSLLPTLLSLLAMLPLAIGPLCPAVCPQSAAVLPQGTADCCCGTNAGSCCAVAHCRPDDASQEPALPAAPAGSDQTSKIASLVATPAVQAAALSDRREQHADAWVVTSSDIHPSLLQLSIRLNI